MKKFLYFLFAVLALSCTFVACSDDDDDDAAAITGNPAPAAAGTYVGTWTIEGDVDTVTTSGTITVAATDSAYTADFTFVADEVSMYVTATSTSSISLDATSVSNITYAGSTSRFMYQNGSENNGLGTAFAGIIEDGSITSYFTITQKVGRKSYTFKYNFEGTKQ